MPFTPHPEFHEPEGDAISVWRYMDLTKFLSVLDKSALYFVRLDKLAKFDSFEGYYTTANLEFEQLKYNQLPKELKDEDGFKDEKTFEAMKEFSPFIRQFAKKHRETTFVNSWHVQVHESAAMWSQYLKSQDGLAIQSTYKKLIDSYNEYEEYEIHIGTINYIDYNIESIPMKNLLSPFLYKRKSFEHEQELRCLIWTPQHGKNELMDLSKNKYKDTYGIYVHVNVETLIERIYLAPSSPEWMLDLLKSLMMKFSLDKPVIQSDLASVPLY